VQQQPVEQIGQRRFERTLAGTGALPSGASPATVRRCPEYQRAASARRVDGIRRGESATLVSLFDVDDAGADGDLDELCEVGDAELEQ
jgi:hypothetical protein